MAELALASVRAERGVRHRQDASKVLLIVLGLRTDGVLQTLQLTSDIVMMLLKTYCNEVCFHHQKVQLPPGWHTHNAHYTLVITPLVVNISTWAWWELPGPGRQPFPDALPVRRTQCVGGGTVSPGGGLG